MLVYHPRPKSKSNAADDDTDDKHRATSAAAVDAMMRDAEELGTWCHTHMCCTYPTQHEHRCVMTMLMCDVIIHHVVFDVDVVMRQQQFVVSPEDEISQQV